MAPRLREVIGSIPEIKGVMSHVGRPDDGTDVTSYFNLEFNAPLIPMEQWRTKPVMILGHEVWQRDDHPRGDPGRADEEVRGVPAVNFNFSQLIRDNVEEALSGVKGANSIKLFGNDLDILERNGPAGRQHPEQGPGDHQRGAVPHPRPAQPGDPDRPPRVRPLRDQRGRRRGGGPGRRRRPGVHADGRGGEDLRHRAPPARSTSATTRRSSAGSRSTRPGQDGKPGAADPARAAGRDRPAQARGDVHLPREQPPVSSRSSSASRAATWPRPSTRPSRRSATQSTAPSCPKGYDIDWAGEFEQMQQANERLMWIVPLSIGLIMILLYTAFNSMKDALLVMANVVAATMGGVWALKLTGTPFSISAAVGFISIFGVAVQDGVLLISYFNQMRAAGLAGQRVGDARRRAAGPAGGDDLADRGAGAVPGRHGRPRSARRPRSRWPSSSSAACS